MIYIQSRSFFGIAAREVNKMSNFNSKDNQKIIKRIQKGFKESQRRGGIMIYAQSRDFYGLAGRTGSRKLKREPGEG